MATNSTLDSEGAALKPGALYCEVIIDFEDNKTYGRLLRFGGVVRNREFWFDADTGEEVIPDFDEVVLQNAGIDSGFICCGANPYA